LNHDEGVLVILVILFDSWHFQTYVSQSGDLAKI